MTIRPFRDQDRGPVLTFLGDPRTLDSPSHRLHVAEEAGAIVGAAVLIVPDAGDQVSLGFVTAPPGRRDLFYRLVRACAQDALSRGFTRGYFPIHDERLLDLLRRDFAIAPIVVGRDPLTGRVTSWEVPVDLADAVRQLDRVL